MNVVYVAGGSYKSFYINNFSKIKKCDLLIFNFNVLYKINSISKNNLVIKEILNLSQTINCAIIAGVEVCVKQKNVKKILICRNKKIKLFNRNEVMNLKIKEIIFNIAFEGCIVKGNNKIIFCNNKPRLNVASCSLKKTYLFCYNKGLLYVCNKKIKRNFNKCSKFILK